MTTKLAWIKPMLLPKLDIVTRHISPRVMTRDLHGSSKCSPKLYTRSFKLYTPLRWLYVFFSAYHEIGTDEASVLPQKLYTELESVTIHTMLYSWIKPTPILLAPIARTK